MRFLVTAEIDGIGIYPCSIDARVLTKPVLEGPAGQGDRLFCSGACRPGFNPVAFFDQA
jgi:hypothetical protein